MGSLYSSAGIEISRRMFLSELASGQELFTVSKLHGKRAHDRKRHHGAGSEDVYEQIDSVWVNEIHCGSRAVRSNVTRAALLQF